MNTYIAQEKRPWGMFETISMFKTEAGEDVVTKKITVDPLKRLSLQTHSGRNESWVIVEGDGIATVNGESIPAARDVQISVPKGASHRIENIDSARPLIFIEVSTGRFDENDIVRIEDDYGRA
jgi:mannose-6-phosphate isomerase